MALTPRALKNGKVVYWLSFTWQGKTIWEHAGADKRAALRLEARRVAEVKAGTYRPGKISSAVTVRMQLVAFLDARTNRTADDERAWIRRQFLERPDRQEFLDMPIADVTPPVIRDVIVTLKTKPRDFNNPSSKPLAPRSVSNVAGILRTMFKLAHFEGAIPADPWTLPEGTINRKVVNKRLPYPRADLVQIRSAELMPDERAFVDLLFYTGAREGEVCGLHFSDWDPDSEPLGALLVDSQYADRPLKGDDDDDARPRMIPVHPELAASLKAWRDEGFELVFCRKPTPADFIVPHREGTSIGACHTRSTAYKMWRRICERAGVENRSLHSTRHSFITWARRGGARKDVLERVTHNSAGDMVDQYTHFDWEPLCEAVLYFRLYSEAGTAEKQVEAPGIEPGTTLALEGIPAHFSTASRPNRPAQNLANRSSDRGSRRESNLLDLDDEIARELFELALVERIGAGRGYGAEPPPKPYAVEGEALEVIGADEASHG